METDEIVVMMSKSVDHVEWTCAEAAGLMAGVLKKLYPRLSTDDFNYLVMIGSILFREGVREYESRRIAHTVIDMASKRSRSS